MALSGELGKAGMIPASVYTKAVLVLDMKNSGPTITEIDLDVTVKIPGADNAAFQKAVETAKHGCPVSRLLNCNIEVDATLES